MATSPTSSREMLASGPEWIMDGLQHLVGPHTALAAPSDIPPVDWLLLPRDVKSEADAQSAAFAESTADVTSILLRRQLVEPVFTAQALFYQYVTDTVIGAYLKDERGSTTIGLVGCGILGQRVLNGILDAGIAPSRVLVSTRRPSTLDTFSRKGVRVFYDNARVFRESRLLLLCCLSNQLSAVARDARGAARRRCLVVSFVAGTSTAKVRQLLGRGVVCATGVVDHAWLGEKRSSSIIRLVSDVRNGTAVPPKPATPPQGEAAAAAAAAGGGTESKTEDVTPAEALLEPESVPEHHLNLASLAPLPSTYSSAEFDEAPPITLSSSSSSSLTEGDVSHAAWHLAHTADQVRSLLGLARWLAVRVGIPESGADYLAEHCVLGRPLPSFDAELAAMAGGTEPAEPATTTEPTGGTAAKPSASSWAGPVDAAQVHEFWGHFFETLWKRV